MRLRHIPGSEESVISHPYSIRANAEMKGKWAASFPSIQPLYVEIGMGKGQFLIDMAQQYPEINFIGFERYSSVMLRALQKIDEMEQPPQNIRFVCENAAMIHEFFAPGEIDRIYLNFSDPWPKDRHAKRRLTSSVFLEKYKTVLSKEGQLEFKTDNETLFDFSLEEIQVSNWTLKAVTRDLHHDDSMNQGNIMTEYEARFSSRGNPIYKLIAVPN